MSRKLNGQPSGVAFDKERILALSTFLRKGPIEFETCVSGGSMGRALPEGSKIHVRFATENDLTAGQVITYVSKHGLVAHRLVQCVTSNDIHYLITRGDATVCRDVPVRTSAVIGIVTEFQTAGSCQPVGPPAGRWFGCQLVALPVSGVILTLLKLNPQASCSMATHIAGIRRSILGAAQLARRFAPRHFSAGADS